MVARRMTDVFGVLRAIVRPGGRRWPSLRVGLQPSWRGAGLPRGGRELRELAAAARVYRP